MEVIKKRVLFWMGGIVLAAACLFLRGCFAQKDVSNKAVITVNAPSSMHWAIKETLSNSKLDRNYVLEFTEESNANFVITNKKSNNSKLMAYSPFVAVFNQDRDLYSKLEKDEIFITSKVSKNDLDFCFKKVIDQILSDENSEFKVYCPSRNSVYWDEFYDFLLFTVNDGYYPKNADNMKEVTATVEKFLKSKNVEQIDLSTLERLGGISKNSIYFMPYADLGKLFDISAITSCRVMYPEIVVYHSYYANFDDIGKILYDAFNKDTFLCSHVGYYNLHLDHFNTLYYSGVNSLGANYDVDGTRDEYNGVEIPDVTINNTLDDKEEE